MAQRETRDRILVAGAGALGSVFGGLLARAGWPVVMLGRAEHMDVVRRDGLRVEGLFGDHVVRGIEAVSDATALRGGFDNVLVTAKSYDTAAIARTVAPHLTPDGMVVCLQNGLGNLERVAHVVGPSRVIGARVIFGAELLGAGRVRVTVNAAPVLVGSPDRLDAERRRRAVIWAGRFAKAEIPSEPTENLLGELWGKVFYNAALNPMGALLGVPYGYLPGDPDARAIMDQTIEEAFAVAHAERMGLRWRNADAYRACFYDELVPATAAHRSSMLQDLERGRPTEIDAINGYVSRRGEALGVPAPVNATLTHMIRARVRCPRAHEARWIH